MTIACSATMTWSTKLLQTASRPPAPRGCTGTSGTTPKAVDVQSASCTKCLSRLGKTRSWKHSYLTGRPVWNRLCTSAVSIHQGKPEQYRSAAAIPSSRLGIYASKMGRGGCKQIVRVRAHLQFWYASMAEDTQSNTWFVPFTCLPVSSHWFSMMSSTSHE